MLRIRFFNLASISTSQESVALLTFISCFPSPSTPHKLFLLQEIIELSQTESASWLKFAQMAQRGANGGLVRSQLV